MAQLWTSLLLIISSVPIVSSAMSLPVLYVEGTHYEVAREIGTTFKERILEFYRLNEDLKAVLIPFVATKRGKQIYTDYVKTVNATYPQYLDEMRGISDATGIPFLHVFVSHMAAEIEAFMALEPLEDCSDVHIVNSHLTMIAHNEDTNPLIKDRGYVISAKIKNVNPRGLLTVAEEQFTAYSYPGYLQGNTFAFTGTGLVLTANALYPKYPKTGRKIPRYVLNRAILSAQNIVDLERILKNVNYGCAFGFSVNAADFSKLPVTATYNYEVAPSDEAKSIVSKITIRPERTRASRSTNIGYYYHFNMYDHYQIEQNPKSITSSQHRKARAFRLPVPRSDDDARVILGDTLDRKYPIYRTPRPTDPGCTVATGEFDLTNCKLSIYKSNPKTTKIPLVQIEIPCNNT